MAGKSAANGTQKGTGKAQDKKKGQGKNQATQTSQGTSPAVTQETTQPPAGTFQAPPETTPAEETKKARKGQEDVRQDLVPMKHFFQSGSMTLKDQQYAITDGIVMVEPENVAAAIEHGLKKA